MSKNNLRGITLVGGPLLGIHSLTLIIPCPHNKLGAADEWLGRRTRILELAGSRPVLTTTWCCFSVDSSSTPR